MFSSEHGSHHGWVKWLAGWCKEDVNVPQAGQPFLAAKVNPSNLLRVTIFQDLTSNIGFFNPPYQRSVQARSKRHARQTEMDVLRYACGGIANYMGAAAD
jgi:hypothetical protein